MSTIEPIRGRGSAANAPNRFIPLYREAIAGWTEEGDPAPRTRFFRDDDVLGELARYDAVAVFLSITTLDPDLSRTMEPRASIPEARLRAVRELTDAGVPTGILMAPVIPGLTDHEAPAILEAAAKAG